jgi:hypothetical protein
LLGRVQPEALRHCFSARKKSLISSSTRSTFPRDKICGDALSGKVLDVLNKLDEKIGAEIYSR